MGNHIWRPLGRSLVVPFELVFFLSFLLVTVVSYMWLFFWCLFYNFWMSWLGVSLSKSGSSCFRICSGDRQHWQAGRSSSSVWPLPWTRTLKIRVEKNPWRREKYVYLFISFFFFFHFLHLSLIFFFRKDGLLARTNMLVLKEWRMNPCFSWRLTWRNTNWMKRKVRWSSIPLSTPPPLLKLLPSKWWWLLLQLLTLKGRAKLERALGRIRLQLLGRSMMWLQTRNLMGWLSFHLMN